MIRERYTRKRGILLAHIDNRIQRTAVLAFQGAQPEDPDMVGHALRRIPGVAAVSLTAGLLSVTYDPSTASPAQFLNLARQAGFSVELAT